MSFGKNPDLSMQALLVLRGPDRMPVGGRAGNSLMPHLPAGICYHGFTAGRGADPAGSAPGGGSSVPVIFIIYLNLGVTLCCISELNILHLPFFHHGKDPLEDFDYNDPRCNPLLRPAAARTPSFYLLHTSLQAV
ncbi:UDP-glucuronate:xylan alpha-glucuronosyltransferase 3 [Dorcoceras hygrometricum]|uniref:UDP-glucuronate:xylan alpha-glucuronosyltransferase 3 n=1 Tax=Dorcoceras hygrometricum TaxID=472368 RepID=A0A2Z7B4K2_9LAMI|nr:UDP-glucuronate:xylan alpha-glucuronosyltransferase 3 [Dorcoceras hygrometricum]